MKNRKFKNYLKTGILLIGISLMLCNCENDNEINHSQEVTENKKLDYSLEKINYSELIKDEQIKKSLPFIEHRFSTKKQSNIYGKSSTKVAENLTILTEEINRIVVEDVITWTFEIESPILESSDFENFLVKKYNDEFRYFLVSYIKNIENDENLYKKVTLHAIPEESLDLTGVNLRLKEILIKDAGESDEEGEEGGSGPCEGVIIGYEFEKCNQNGSHNVGTFCCQHFGGSHGCKSVEDFYGCGNTCNGTKNVPIYDFSNCNNYEPYTPPSGPSNNTPDDTSNEDQTGGGSNETSSGGSPILSVPTYNGDISELRQNLISNLGITNQNQINWINSENNNSAVLSIYAFGEYNNYSTETKNFAKEAIEIHINLDDFDELLKSPNFNPLDNPWINSIRKYAKRIYDLKDNLSDELWENLNRRIDQLFIYALTKTALEINPKANTDKDANKNYEFENNGKNGVGILLYEFANGLGPDKRHFNFSEHDFAKQLIDANIINDIKTDFEKELVKKGLSFQQFVSNGLTLEDGSYRFSPDHTSATDSFNKHKNANWVQFFIGGTSVKYSPSSLSGFIDVEMINPTSRNSLLLHQAESYPRDTYGNIPLSTIHQHFHFTLKVR